MRELKFRVWNGNKAEMIMLDPNIERFASEDLVECVHWKVMQYTGLKDKDGKEIYEGDIIQLEGFKPLVVKWVNGLAGFADLFGYQMQANSPNNVSVIGNIYENPKLLKENGNEK